MWSAAWLSHSNFTAPISILKSFRSCTNHRISLVTLAKARYSASAEERATVVCFFDFQEIKASPKKTQYPEVDFLVSTQFPQSASAYAVRSDLKQKGKKDLDQGHASSNEVSDEQLPNGK